MSALSYLFKYATLIKDKKDQQMFYGMVGLHIVCVTKTYSQL